MDVLLVKTDGNRLIAAYDSDLEKIKKLPIGETILCKITRPRNVLFHRKFFALLNLVFHNQEAYKNVDDLREDLIICAGFFTTRTNFYGETIKKAKSINFASMDEDEFSDLYNKVLDVIIDWFQFQRKEIIDNVASFY